MMLASRVRKARKPSTCPLCHGAVTAGQYIGLTGMGWCHTGCIVRENSHGERRPDVTNTQTWILLAEVGIIALAALVALLRK